MTVGGTKAPVWGGPGEQAAATTSKPPSQPRPAHPTATIVRHPPSGCNDVTPEAFAESPLGCSP